MNNLKNILIAVILAAGFSGCAQYYRFKVNVGDCLEFNGYEEVYKVTEVMKYGYMVRRYNKFSQKTTSSYFRFEELSKSGVNKVDNFVCEVSVNE